MPGFSSNALSLAFGFIDPALKGYNFNNLTLLAYLSPAFIGYRGSVNWSFNALTGGEPAEEISMVRDNNNVSGIYRSTTSITDAIGFSAYLRTTMEDRQGGLSGQCLTNGNTQAGLNVQMPNYSIFKFQSTNPRNSNKGIAADGSILDAYLLTVVKKNASATPTMVVNAYAAAGTDFSLYFFLNVPTFWYYQAIPVPA
jgi:hypothetical protein